MSDNPFPPIKPVRDSDQEDRLEAAAARMRQLRRRRSTIGILGGVALVAAVVLPIALLGGGYAPQRSIEVVGGATTTASAGNPTSSATTVSPSTSVVSTTAPSTSATTVPIDTAIEVYGDCKTPRVEPSAIVVTCADYGEVFEGLQWDSWTSSGASAVGTAVYSHCYPACAEGRLSVPNTRVVLSAPVTDASGQSLWSMIQVSPPPPGSASGGPYPLPTRSEQ